MIFSPLEQFELFPFFSFSLGSKLLAFTNETYFMMLVSVLIFYVLYFSFVEIMLVPSRYQLIVEYLLCFVKNLVISNIGKNQICYFPLINFVFFFILLSNLVGIIPFTFTLTSHIIVTFTLALSLFIGINITGFRKHGIVLFEFFLPAGAPLGVAPLFVIIELISYIARVFSLSIRLFANLISGHALLKILVGFAWMMLFGGFFLKLAAFVPLSIVIAVTMLEFAIAFLQAYVFTILLCLYLHDVIILSH